jgi:hypothetical protein
MAANYKAPSYEPLAGHIFQPNLDALKQNLFITARKIIDPIQKAEDTFEAVKWNANPGMDTEKTNQIKDQMQKDIDRLAQARVDNPDDRKTSLELKYLAADYRNRFLSGDIYQINKRYDDLKKVKENIAKDKNLDSERKQQYLDVLDNASYDIDNSPYPFPSDFNIPTYANTAWGDIIYKNYKESREKKDRDTNSYVGSGNIKTTNTTQRIGQDTKIDAPLYFLQQMGVIRNQNKDQFKQEHELGFRNWSSIDYTLDNITPNEQGRLSLDNISDEDLDKLKQLRARGVLSFNMKDTDDPYVKTLTGISFNNNSSDPLAIEGSNFIQKVMPEYTIDSQTQSRAGDININTNDKDNTAFIKNTISVEKILGDKDLYDLYRELNPDDAKKYGMKEFDQLTATDKDRLLSNEDINIQFGSASTKAKNMPEIIQSEVGSDSKSYGVFYLNGEEFHGQMKDAYKKKPEIIDGKETGKDDLTQEYITNIKPNNIYYITHKDKDKHEQIQIVDVTIKTKQKVNISIGESTIEEKEYANKILILTAHRNFYKTLPKIYKKREVFNSLSK